MAHSVTADGERIDPTEPMAKFRRPSDDEVRDIVTMARSLSPDDERVTDHTAGLLKLSSLTLSTLLFQAECHHTLHVPEVKNDFETGTISVHLHVAPVEFEGHGEGWIGFKITTDAEGETVESLTVNVLLNK